MNNERTKPQSTKTPELPITTNERGKKVRHYLFIACEVAIALSAIGVGVVGISAQQGGSDSPNKFGAVNPNIHSITLEEGANIRHDPYVGDAEDGTLITQLDETVRIDNIDDVRVRTDTNNGTWYGLSEADIKTVVEGFNPEGDNDNVVWVNNQGAVVNDK